MPPSAGPASRPWSPSARVSANASAGSAPAPPAGCDCGTTTGRTTWPTIFQQEIAFFGIDSSPSFVREPEGNGVAERFIRTLKENLLWGRSFETIEDLRLALLAFKRTLQTNNGCSRNTRTEAPRRCDATSSGWTAAA